MAKLESKFATNEFIEGGMITVSEATDKLIYSPDSSTDFSESLGEPWFSGLRSETISINCTVESVNLEPIFDKLEEGDNTMKVFSMLAIDRLTDKILAKKTIIAKDRDAALIKFARHLPSDDDNRFELIVKKIGVYESLSND